MVLKLLFILLLVCSAKVCLGEDAPEIQTPLGPVRGSWKTSSNGKKFASFEGIPFAKPPVDDLRFEAPQPVEPWNGTWDATKSYTCVQTSLDPTSGVVYGDEDCLYINVYVPEEQFTNGKNFDVLAIIHGGAFMLGSAQMGANPAVLLDKDIILVTFNYRLGYFGFLSTEDGSIPGNNGMKDQVLALKWIQQNIASFGGNPKSVTIAGLSAGGASVHLHYLSPLSKGLFVRGISHSGTALNPWVIKENPLDNAKKLAVLVGCPDSPTIELKRCLKQKPAQLLMEQLEHFYGFGIMPFSPFSPVIEQHSSNSFLSEEPYDVMEQGKIFDVPWITSVVAHEGMLPSLFLYPQLDQIDQIWPEIAHYVLDYNDTVPIHKREEIANKIKKFYIGSDGHINLENFNKFTQIFTDRLFFLGAEAAVKLQSKVVKSPVYYYYFNYGKGAIKATVFYTKEEVEGIAHGADGIYFYDILRTPLSENDTKLRDACLDMLYSFATTGKPSYDGTDKWQPVKGSQLVYLNVTDADDIKLQTVDSLAPYDFWDSLDIEENLNLIKDEL